MKTMSLEIIMQYFTQYGGIAIFIIVLLEYMNLPGFPAGVIMPLAGVFAARGNIGFVTALLITIGAGLAGSLILYYIGLFGGDAVLKFYVKKFPKQKEPLEKNMQWIREKGCVGLFLAKLIPMLRTLISIPAGVIRMNIVKYVVSSVLGIFVWNLVFVGAGYFLGEAIFQYIS